MIISTAAIKSCDNQAWIAVVVGVLTHVSSAAGDRGLRELVRVHHPASEGAGELREVAAAVSVPILITIDQIKLIIFT